LLLSLHPPSFTIAELLHNAIPKPVPTLFRLYVMSNGLLFHYTGRSVGFLKGRTESFQTERGMRVALNRAGFVNPSFLRRLSRRLNLTPSEPLDGGMLVVVVTAKEADRRRRRFRSCSGSRSRAISRCCSRRPLDGRGKDAALGKHKTLSTFPPPQPPIFAIGFSTKVC
jgi:hypothetical protein